MVHTLKTGPRSPVCLQRLFLEVETSSQTLLGKGPMGVGPGEHTVRGQGLRAMVPPLQTLGHLPAEWSSCCREAAPIYLALHFRFL